MDSQFWLHDIYRFDIRLGTLGGTPITLFGLGFIVISACVLFIAANALKRWLIARLLRFGQFDTGTGQAIGSLVRYTVLVIGFMLIMQTAGINLTTFNVLAGAVGVGVGFGLQNIVSNFISGLIVMFERPVKPGDRINVGGIEGSVLEIGTRSTTMLTTENIVAIIPNQKFITEIVKNWQHGADIWQLRIVIAVNGESDPYTVRDILLHVAEGNSQILHTPPPTVFLTSFNGSNFNFELRVQTLVPLDQHTSLLSNINFELLDALMKQGIKLG
jgi:small-conductance mechanosensitive channel